MRKATRVAYATGIITGSVATALLLLLIALPAGRPVLAAESATASPTWDRQAAARYMDSREVWWQAWDHDKRDQGTRCVSCHTQVPYALVRPALRAALGETTVSPMEAAMLSDVEKRVRNWKDMLPFYSDEIYGTARKSNRATPNPSSTPSSSRATTAARAALAFSPNWPSIMPGSCNPKPAPTPAPGSGRISITRRGSQRNRNITGLPSWPSPRPPRPTTTPAPLPPPPTCKPCATTCN